MKVECTYKYLSNKFDETLASTIVGKLGNPSHLFDDWVLNNLQASYPTALSGNVWHIGRPYTN